MVAREDDVTPTTTTNNARILAASIIVIICSITSETTKLLPAAIGTDHTPQNKDRTYTSAKVSAPFTVRIKKANKE